MRFQIALDTNTKLSLLDDATRFEPAGNEPLSENSHSAKVPKSLPCVSEVTTPNGKQPILKAMMTTACERNCYYCPFQAGRNSLRRITFTPDEMATAFQQLQQSRHVNGIFLSSGIIKGSITTQDKILDTAEIIRRQYGYRGYVHLKIMPGAEFEQIRRAMQLADRVSVNLEAPTAERLQALAPKKDYWNELFERLLWIGRLRTQEKLRASAVTQFVVGAVGDTDLELLKTSEVLYRQFGLRRAYYSAFRPVSNTPFENVAPVSDERQLRLYQASFLLRDYGWDVEDLPFQADTNLPLHVDPKRALADKILLNDPVEINRASHQELLRVPGIGPISAGKILAVRKHTTFTDLTQLGSLGIHNPAQMAPYVLLSGRRPEQQLSLF